ncbi:MAG: hypothetical protein ACK5Y2_04685 [Bdellovibrionales bacterium]
MTFFFLGLSFLLAAAQSPGPILKQYSQVLPQMLVAEGVQTVGDLNIKKLSQELEKVQWEVTQQIIPEGSGKPRFACNYFVSKRVVCNSMATSPAVLPLVTLHEALGALGYLDEDYEISSALAVHALSKRRAPIPGVSDRSFQGPRRTQDQVYQSQRGGTSVGGGGDSVGITVKTFAIAALASNLEAGGLTVSQQAQVVSAITRITAAAFENNVSAIEQEVQFHVRGEKETVLIPLSQWTWIQWNTTSPHMLLALTSLFDPIFKHFLTPL